MRIRTQDRKSSVDIDGMIINIVTDTDSTRYAIVAEKLGIVKIQLLGIYSTKEKALKVLDMIEDAYLRANQGYYIHNVVFHMPSDSEVNV